MPSLLVIRLHPIEPITGDAFTSYLNGLFITAHDLSFTDPTGAATPALEPEPVGCHESTDFHRPG